VKKPQAKFTAGCDPEMFGKIDGRFVSMIPFVEGTKSEPYFFKSGAFVMRDNVAVEFGIPPASSEDQFVDSILTAIEEVKAYLPDEVELAIVPSAHFTEDQLWHPEAQEFGCSPDFNAWLKGDMNIAPHGATIATFRSCGGHFHTGFDWARKNPWKFIQWNDLFNGMISTVLDNSPEAIDRRILYGKAGCYRPTSYGCEYRTMSNYWIKDEVLIRLQYSLVNDICLGIESGKMVLPDIDADVVQKTINDCDEKFARAVVRDYLYDQYFTDNTKNLLEKAGYEDK